MRGVALFPPEPTPQLYRDRITDDSGCHYLKMSSSHVDVSLRKEPAFSWGQDVAKCERLCYNYLHNRKELAQVSLNQPQSQEAGWSGNPWDQQPDEPDKWYGRFKVVPAARANVQCACNCARVRYAGKKSTVWGGWPLVRDKPEMALAPARQRLGCTPARAARRKRAQHAAGPARSPDSNGWKTTWRRFARCSTRPTSPWSTSSRRGALAAADARLSARFAHRRTPGVRAW